MWSHRSAVLIGNPGVSKSWFQWYIIYLLVNQVRDQADVKDEFNEPIKAIVRQIGSDGFDIYIHKRDTVLRSECRPFILHNILRSLDPDTSLYLFEPGSSKIEPMYMDHDIRTIATCSPDTVRYKEFCKSGALKYYMPCWTLAELKAVGNRIVQNNPSLKEFMSPQAIEERYKRFGGIMRYVISNSKDADKSWRIAQDEAIKRTKAIDLFSLYVGIEKMDDKKDNISDFVLCYNVEQTKFRKFNMKITSDNASENLCS